MRCKVVRIRKKYSYAGRIRAALLILSVVLFASACIFAWNLQNISVKQMQGDMRQYLDLYSTQRSTDMKNVEYFINTIKSFDRQISVTGAKEDLSDSYTDLHDIGQLLRFNQSSLPVKDGLFVCFEKSSCFISAPGTRAWNTDISVSLRDRLQDGTFPIDSLIDSSGWVPMQIGDAWYFLYVRRQNNTLVGAWVSLDTLLSGFDDMQGVMVITDEDGKVPGTSEEDTEEAADAVLQASGESWISRTTWKGETYEDHAMQLSGTGCILHCLIPSSVISRRVRPIPVAFLFFPAGCVALAAMMLFLTSRLFARPILVLEKASEDLDRNSADLAPCEENEPCLEAAGILHSMNGLIHKVQKLERSVYEEKLERKNLEMIFLRTQVKPHFFINCLNLICCLADGTKEHSEVLKKFIPLLSEHLRYTLSSRQKVPLSEELRYENSCIELNKVRFPGCITYRQEADDAAMDASVFPLILIMFTENTFKYNMAMGEELRVVVRAQVSRDGTRLHLVHIDSGDGYPEELAGAVNDPVKSREQLQGKDRIGILNIIRRLQLYYDDSVSIHFSNEPGMGARIDMDIPYIRYQSENTGEDQKNEHSCGGR